MHCLSMERDIEWITIHLWSKEQGRLALHWLPFHTAQRFQTGGGEEARWLGAFSALGDPHQGAHNHLNYSSREPDTLG